MNNRLIFVVSFTSIFIILASISGSILCVNAQSDLYRNNSSAGSNTTSIANSSSIITPWNTGNERINSDVSTIR
ncbi:hypothetical protein BH23THE1_BH23THE1_27090 [soil metagenome]